MAEDRRLRNVENNYLLAVNNSCGLCHNCLMLPDAPKKKILLIEDDVFMVDLLTKELQQVGFDIVVAHTGTEGVQEFKKVKPDLVLLDLFLPDLNGFEVLRQIRQDEVGYTTRVVILSNASEEQNIKEAQRLGVVDYLIKANYSLPEIVEKIRGVINAPAVSGPAASQPASG